MISLSTPTMTDKKGSVATANRLAMSKALGAAFLNHQVEQLEKTVSRNGPGSEWRGRRNGPPHTDTYSRTNNPNPKARSAWSNVAKPPPKILTKNAEEIHASVPEMKKGRPEAEKDADVVVVDASVLIHSIAWVKKWCREGREEIIIIPLEALNTLDLLKKGTTPLAQRARTASRVLEAHVGANSRIRVQRDEAFVLWEEIPFKDVSPAMVNNSPEWVRRTVCCARWELQHPSLPEANKNKAKPTVVLAVVTSIPDASDVTNNAAAAASPVPLPAPQVNRHEPRCSGTLISQWAKKAGMEILDIPAGQHPNAGPQLAAPKDIPRRTGDQGRWSGDHGRRSPEDDRNHGRPRTPGGGRGRRNSHMRNIEHGNTPPTSGLVERPPAVMAMMEAVAQPSRQLRVLARGEKLEPDP